MSSHSAIGGYFELEQGHDQDRDLHPDSIKLNTARNCFEYVLRVFKPSHVYMPKYTCEVLFEPLSKLGVGYSSYAVNENLELTKDITPREDELLLYTNYFGLKDAYCDELAARLGRNLVLDCSQALFYKTPSKTVHAFYSPRKFLGVADGGYLYMKEQFCRYEDLPIDDSTARMTHLFIRLNEGAEAGYAEFVKNDKSLEHNEIRRMSDATKNVLNSLNYERIQKTRRSNFRYLRKNLSVSGSLPENLEMSACPMIFPYFTGDSALKQRLIDEKIFVATYWPNVLRDESENSLEYWIADHLVALPIDQRYNESDMEHIVEVINEN